MKHLFFALICVLMLALSNAFAQSDVEKVLQEAKTLGEEGLKTQDFKKLQDARIKALSIANQNKKAYTLIGDLYFNSYLMCKAGDAVISRGVFLIAYDMYVQANDTEKMKNAKEQFPSITDVFTLAKKEGEDIKVGCWINEKTILRVRQRQ